MKFASVLADYIGERKLEEITFECAKRGVNLSPSYLSRMRSGTRPAPEDENVVRVLAEVCGKDPDRLVFAAKLERHPDEAFREYSNLAIRAFAEVLEENRVLRGICKAVYNTLNDQTLSADFVRRELRQIVPKPKVDIENSSVVDQFMDYVYGVLQLDTPGDAAGAKPYVGPHARRELVRSLASHLANLAEVPVEGLWASIRAMRAFRRTREGSVRAAKSRAKLTSRVRLKKAPTQDVQVDPVGGLK